MYLLQSNKTTLTQLTQVTFTSLGLRERQHLQEWLANTPEALGEELLIIQKEFDGFDDTRERLDLLALDKEGQLVIIENKLDDSGRDVVWQALKYASYCHSLSKVQILEIFQKYLDKYAGGGDARAQLCEFMEDKEFEELELNSGKHQQRIMLVAAQFRKEVTSTALWLMGHKVRIQCFKVTPWQHGEQVFLNVDQVIPPPETKDFLIALADKEEEDAATTETTKTRHDIRQRFWAQMLPYFKKHGFDLYANVNPTHDHWLSAGSGVSGVCYHLVFGKNMARVELVFTRSSQEDNKWFFSQMATQKEVLESTFGKPLHWNRLDHRKSSRIEFEEAFDGYNEANWPAITQWLLDHMRRLHKAVDRPIQDFGRKFREQGK